MEYLKDFVAKRLEDPFLNKIFLSINNQFSKLASTINERDIIARGPWADVRAYGAKGGGVTDDTVAIQAAIDSLTSGGVVFFPEGTYTVSLALTILDNVHLIGMGYKTLLQLANGSDCSVIKNADQANGNDNIGISKLRIYGNKANNATGYGINFDRVTNFSIMDCIINQIDYNGIQITRGNQFWIERNEIANCGSGVSNQSNGIDIRVTTNRFVVANNMVNNSNKNGIRIHMISGTEPHYGIVIGNICNTNGHIGIAIADSRCVVVNNNVCIANTNNGFDFNGLDFCQFIGNIAYNNGIHGINPDTCTEIIVNSNICWHNQRAGIYLVSVDNSVCNGNNCVSNGLEGYAAIDDGILVTDSDNNVISGNRCLDNQGTKTQQYGIKEAGTSDYNLFTNNNLKGNAVTAGIDLVGANSEAHNNIHDAGFAIASAATVTLRDTGNQFNITGTTGITSITASWNGRIVTLRFAGILTVTDGSNLKLAGDFTTSADNTLTLMCDGTNWYEISRSVN